MRSADDRSARKSLAALSADQIHERDEYAVLFSDVARETLPAFQVSWNWSLVLARPHSACRRRRKDEKHRCAVQRGDSSGEAVPRILADQHGCTSPLRLEGPNFESAIDESFLVEKPISRQEELAVNVTDHRPIRS